MVSAKIEPPIDSDESVKMDLAPVVPDSFRRTGIYRAVAFLAAAPAGACFGDLARGR